MPGYVIFSRGRLWFMLFLLTVLPTALYWNTIWARYGLRDDYSVLREAHEEPGKNIRFCGSQARPLEGWLFDITFKHAKTVADLSWARLTGSLVLGLLSALAAWSLIRMEGWSDWGATCVGALLALVPSAQVMVGWSILWVYALSALLSVGAFVLAETAFVHGNFSRGKRILMVIGAGLLLVISAFLFQPNALCYLILFSAGMLDHCLRPWRDSLGWIARHALMLGLSLIVAFVLIKILFASGVLQQSKRVAFEPDLIGKWFWFLRHVVPNALALFVVNDIFSRTTPYYEISALIMGLLLVTGTVLVWLRRGRMGALLSYGMLIPLGTAGYAINFIASERWANYRTIYPLAGIVLVFAAFSLEKIVRSPSSAARWLCHGFRAAVLVVAAVLARHQAYTLIARPQEMELQRVKEESVKIVPGQAQRIYIITPTPKIAPAPLVYADELGSLSTDSTWVPKEMLKHVLHERFPDIERFDSLDNMISGAEEPPPGLYDVVLDLRLPRK